MLITLPSGQTMYTPADPRTWVDQDDAVTGTPVMSYDLERQVSSAVAFHRGRMMFQGDGGSQSIPASTWTPVEVGEIWDAARGHSDTSNPARVYAPVTASGADWYLCVGMVPVGASSTGAVIAGLRLDGGTIYEGAKLPLGSGHAATAMVCDLLKVDSFEYIELMTYQNSGGALSLSSSTTKTAQLTMRWATVHSGTTVDLPGTPRTWTAGDVLTADSAGTGEVPLNTHIRDVLRWLRYPPAARLDSAGTSQTVPSSTWTSINFTAEQFDNYGGHSTSSNPSRYTVQRDGLYFVYGLASIAETNTTGYRISRLLVNGTDAYGGTSARPVASSTIGSSLPACAHIRLEAGDYVELQSYQSSGSSLAVKDGTGDASKLIALWRGL
jgi:hypothetical protein